MVFNANGFVKISGPKRKKVQISDMVKFVPNHLTACYG